MAMEQTQQTVRDAEKAVQSATERAARKAHETVDTLRDYGDEAATRVREGTRVATERSRELMDQVTAYINDHPLAAIGIAAGVGFILGALARRGASSPE